MNSTTTQQHKAFRLRRALPEDSAAIRQVATETWNITYAQTVRSSNRERVISQSYSDTSLRRALRRADRDSWFWVVEQVQVDIETEVETETISTSEPRLIGFAEVILRPGSQPDAELTRIYVLPEWQQRGVGRALVETLLSTLRQLEGDLRPPRLWLSVEAHNSRAIAFYERRGFQFFRDFYANLPGQLLDMQEYVLDI